MLSTNRGNKSFLPATIALVAIFTLLTPACGLVPIYSVDNAEYVSVNGKVTLEQAKKAIIDADSKRRWQFEEIEPGYLVATLRKRKVVVDIRYSTKAFSITYKDSEDLNYDGFTIHPKYNKWIQNLQHDINTQFDNM